MPDELQSRKKNFFFFFFFFLWKDITIPLRKLDVEFEEWELEETHIMFHINSG